MFPGEKVEGTHRSENFPQVIEHMHFLLLPLRGNEGKEEQIKFSSIAIIIVCPRTAGVKLTLA